MEGWTGLSGLIPGGQGAEECTLWSQLRTGTQGERAQRWTGEAPRRTNATHSAPHHAQLAWRAAGLGGLPLRSPSPGAASPLRPCPPHSKHSVIMSVKDQKPQGGNLILWAGWGPWDG